MHDESGKNPEDYPDEEPFSEEELAYAAAYQEVLLVGAEEPSDAGLDPARAAAIRHELDRRWRASVRRIYRRRR